MPEDIIVKPVEVVPLKTGIVKTTAGGKDYFEKFKECLLLKYTNVTVPVDKPTQPSGDTSLDKFKGICINPELRPEKKISKRNCIGFVSIQDSELNIDKVFFKRFLCQDSETGECIPTLSLKEGFQLIKRSETQQDILFIICDGANTETLTLAGNEEILQNASKYLTEAQDETDVFESKSGSVPDLDSVQCSDEARRILARDVVKSLMERSGNQDSAIQRVLEECLCTNLKQCEDWTASLLSDLLTVNSSQQYIRDINDHVIDYLTQSFRQKHGMLAIHDTQEYEANASNTADHVTVLQKLSPTLSREFRLEGTNILDYMYEQDALSDTERQSILAQPTDKRKNEAFIDHLCSKYSMVKFKKLVLPILHLDDEHKHLAAAIEKELNREDVRPIESKCTFCKVRGLIDLRTLSEPLLSMNTITQAVRRDLCSPTMPSRYKWGELLESVGEESFMEALKVKYPHFYEEFQTTGQSPMKCCCCLYDSGILKDVSDVANMDDLVSETGSRISFGLRLSVVDRLGSSNPSSNPFVMDCTAGYRNVCGICHQKIRDTRKLTCDHVFCKVCICNVYRLVKMCPVCGCRLRYIKGTMPPGNMTHKTEQGSLPGFEGFDTIVISYSIEDGIQMDDHPRPGQPYRGIACSAYLPNSLDGQLVLMLLQTAWERGLTFSLRQSLSSSMEFVLSWNGIRHKTNRTGGPRNHGYPDPDYLSSIRKDLTEQGIQTEDLRSTMV